MRPVLSLQPNRQKPEPPKSLYSAAQKKKNGWREKKNFLKTYLHLTTAYRFFSIKNVQAKNAI